MLWANCTSSTTRISRRQQVFADHRQPQAMLITLEIGFHASSSVIVLDLAGHTEIRPTGEDYGM